MACSTCGKKIKPSPALIVAKVLLGEVGLVKVEYLGTVSGSWQGQATEYVYDFTPESSIKYVDRRDAQKFLAVPELFKAV